MSLDSACKGCHMMFLLLCLTSLNMTLSMSVHVAANGIISCFSMAEYYSIAYMYHIFLPIPLLTGV